MTWWDLILGGVETALDFGASFIPGGTLLTKGLKKGVKYALKGTKLGVGMAKDYFAGGNIDFDGLSSDIGDLKNGLVGAKAQIETQGKELHGKIDTVKTELLNQMNQQGAKFDQEIKNLDAKIATATGQLKADLEKEKKEREEESRKLQSAITQVSEELNKVENKLTEAINDLRNEVNERFTQHEQKILDNKRKIEEERTKREEEIRETHSKIKLTNTNLENLRKEKEQLNDDFLNYKSNIDLKTSETQQAFEDTQAEYERKTKIIETKLKDNEDLLEEFKDDLLNVKNEQAQAKLERAEILEELAEQSDLLHFQKHQLNLVSQQMEDVSEEIHERMGKISKDHNKLFTLATDTSQKVNNLTEEVKNISQKTKKLEEQLAKNKQDLEKVKNEAKLTNERLDNFIKSQQLLDHSAEELAFKKLEKSLELKAEETKLLATLKLLQETKKLITPKPAEKNWKVGVQTGTAPKDYPEPEGFMLVPNSYWERNYTGTQVKEDNPYSLFTQEWFNWEEENKLAPEDTKFEPWGQRIQADNESAPLTTPQKRKEQQINADHSQDTQTTEQEKQSELIFEQLETAKSELLTRLQEIQGEIKHNLTSVENNSSQPKTKAKNQAKSTPANFTEELEQKRKELSESIQQDKQAELAKEWETIQDLSEQVLQEPAPLGETSELDNNQKIEELTQQLQELETTQVAHQKQMSKWMLFLIIFLLEYVVYKKNGVLGLVILNVILTIAYYKKDTILKYRDLWEKYFLIIGYVLGNVLAYSASEQEKYKWPSVIGFNLIVLGIYGYTLYQQKQEQAKLETDFEEKTAQIAQENNITSQEWKTANIQSSLLSDYNPFSNEFTGIKTQQLTNLQEIIQEQEIIHQKALELQKQSELLQKSAEIENNLQEIQANLGESQMSWTKIKQRYPEFTERSLFLKELSSIDRILSRNQSKKPSQSFLTKLERMSVNSPEENNLLSQLRLTLEQFIAISQKAYRFTKEEKEYLSDNYSTLTTKQQLSLLNAGLNSLGIDTSEKKKIFVDLNHQISNERNNFGLSTEEKENILRLLVNTLNLSQEQQEYLESMGISFFNASEWQIDNAQKNHLLSFGLQRIILSENQKESLTNLSSDRFQIFSLTEEQKNILQSLAPLTRKDKYSSDSLQLLNSLQLKTTSLSFLTSEEVIPNPNLDFGVNNSPYLPLKLKYLTGEQKVLEAQAREKEKQLSQQKIQANKLSIFKSLWDFAMDEEKREEVNENDANLIDDYTLEEWVAMEALKPYQMDILLILGLKTIPRYNIFELLKFAVEKINNQSWTDFSEEKDLTRGYENYLETQKTKPITINWGKTITELQGNQGISPNLNLTELEQLISRRIQEALTNYQPQEPVINNPDEQEEEIIAETTPAQSSTSRYDDLLNNLNAEDQVREKKKREREAAKNKLTEAERQRREAKLSEKEQKLKEDEEKRQQEQELAEKEEQKRREAEEARSKALQEEQERIFNQKLKNIEEAKKRAEEALENQKKTNELAEQKKRDEITKLEKENQQEQERLANQAKLIEEEKQKKLASIALEDKEQRQLIEKRANEEKARIEQEMNDKRRKNEEELKRQENALLKEKQERQLELDKTQKEIDLQRTLAEELKVIGKRQEDLLKGRKNQQQALTEFREQMYQACLDYPWMDSETRAGTQNPNLSGWGNLRNWLNSYPNLRFNLTLPRSPLVL